MFLSLLVFDLVVGGVLFSMIFFFLVFFLTSCVFFGVVFSCSVEFGCCLFMSKHSLDIFWNISFG